ncbi:MAG: winged helix-turn-helix domain-containing protein [Methanothrix sp.]|nr:winged helix-turn-helix domain-containing protein [Methanothrix sp.]
MKRSKQEIVSVILEVCKSGANKTRIVYQANLNFKTINPYLDILIKNGLIELNQGNYKTTQKGAILMGDLKQVNEKLYGHYEMESVQSEG